MPKHLRGSCIYLCLLFVVNIYLHERKKIEFIRHMYVYSYIFFRPITRLHSHWHHTHLCEELCTLLHGCPLPAADQVPAGGRGGEGVAGPGHVGAQPVHADGGWRPGPRPCPLERAPLQLGVKGRLE